MGRRGPVPKPNSIKRAAGNPGRRQLNDNEPVPPAMEISPPAWVKGAALQVWAQLAPIAIAMKTLTSADVVTFGRYCTMVARFVELTEFLWRDGPRGTTYAKRRSEKTAEGKTVERIEFVYELPQAAEQRRLMQALIQLEDRFGLNASARSRINIQPQAPAAPAAPGQVQKDESLRALFAGGGPAKARPASAG